MGARGAARRAAARRAPRDRAGRGGDPAALVQEPGLRHREPVASGGRLHRGPPQRQAHAGASRLELTAHASAGLSSVTCHGYIPYKKDYTQSRTQTIQLQPWSAKVGLTRMTTKSVEPFLFPTSYKPIKASLANPEIYIFIRKIS